MKPATTYSESNLKKGKCECCGETSDTIVQDDGRCIDCIEEENFFEQIMRKGKKHKIMEIYWIYERKKSANYWI